MQIVFSLNIHQEAETWTIEYDFVSARRLQVKKNRQLLRLASPGALVVYNKEVAAVLILDAATYGAAVITRPWRRAPAASAGATG
jgi:hypothetical protein